MKEKTLFDKILKATEKMSDLERAKLFDVSVSGFSRIKSGQRSWRTFNFLSGVGRALPEFQEGIAKEMFGKSNKLKKANGKV
jgi:hypothetical protein